LPNKHTQVTTNINTKHADQAMEEEQANQRHLPVDTTDDRVFLFGYGSLLNNESRCGSNGCNNAERENDALLVRVSKNWGYTRAFCTRSQTGFTALGLISSDTKPTSAGATVVGNAGIIGVIFEVSSIDLPTFDARERAYDRVTVPAEHIEVVSGQLLNMPKPQDKVYTYIQKPEACLEANRDFPIIQTYVDACLSGCLAWGGEALMQDFVLNTLWWSPYFLNDCPLSRRPWLHRRHYVEVDEALLKNKEHTCMLSRKHAEEYNSFSNSSNTSPSASDDAMGSTGVAGKQDVNSNGSSSSNNSARRSLAGLWGCPPRNPLFAGREGILAALHTGLQNDNFAEISGLGGMGKSSLASEYCNRHFGMTYGLVIYLRAESRASLAADIRKFSFDSNLVDLNSSRNSDSGSSTSSSSEGGGSSNVDIDDNRLIEDFKRHLAGSQSRCLIVFDNLECPAGSITSSRTAVAPYLPRGRLAYKNSHDITNGTSSTAGTTGEGSAAAVSVLVTRRVAGAAESSTEIDGTTFSLALDALRPAESLQFLAKALQTEEVAVEKGEEERELAELETLAERLQHLPLALSQAAAFIKRTDVSAADYLHRLDVRDNSGAKRGLGDSGDALDSVYASLSMALERIETESPVSVKVLRRLAWLSPDNITKKLVLKLLETSASHASTSDLSEAHVAEGDASTKRETTSPSSPNSCSSSNWLFRRPFSTAAALVAASAAGGVAVHWVLSPSSPPAAAASKPRVMNHAARACASLAGAAVSGYFCWLSSLAINPSPRVRFLDATCAPPAHTSLSLPKAENAKSSVWNDDTDTVLESDRVWELLKQFGLLTVRGTRRARVASIHRIQQQFLRQQLQQQQETKTITQRCSSSTPVAACVEHAVQALNELWKKESQPQPGAGAQSIPAARADLGELLEHIQVLSGHVSAALSVHCVDETRGNDAPLRPFGMNAAIVLQLACLLTSAASYATLALSRFDMAESVLALALRLQIGQHSGPDAVAAAAAGSGVIDAPLLARTYHLYGTISRLRGHFEVARECLLCALHIRQKDCVGEDLSVADTLHELGILDIRQGSLDAAQTRLTESLTIKLKSRDQAKGVTGTQVKSRARAPDMACVAGSVGASDSKGETTISATLHQLAVIATFGKRYDDAERLLQQALALDAVELPAGVGLGVGADGRASLTRENTRQLVSRAAATQQLGRVYLRRGQLQQAKTSLQESLAIYTKAYGVMQHINVAAVHHQLGNTLSTLENYAEAEDHFHKALSIRLAVFPDDHIEVIRTYSELAQCVTDKGPAHAPLAEAAWEKQQQRVEHALHRVQATAHADSNAHAMQISHLARHLLSALYARRAHHRRLKDLVMVAQLSTSITYARKLQEGGSSGGSGSEQKTDGRLSVSCGASDSSHGPTEFLAYAGLVANHNPSSRTTSTVSTVSVSVRQAVLAARTAVRKQAKALTLTGSPDVGEVEAIMQSLSKHVEEILEPALASVEEDGEDGDVAYESVYGNMALVRAARRLCADIDSLLLAAEEPLQQLQLIPAPVPDPDEGKEKEIEMRKIMRKIVKELANGLFNACDRLRVEVQALGETVED